jgi:catechol 2,3-dioxygenase-like lactoylglutathione lyase family enzyme
MGHPRLVSGRACELQGVVLPRVRVQRADANLGHRRVENILHPPRRGEGKQSSTIGRMQSLGHIAVVVREYDEAIAYYTGVLGFRLHEDTDMGEGKRWVLVAPEGSRGTSILLARAATAEQASHVGNQTGGRVFLFLHTDDFWRDYRMLESRNVVFVREPKEEPYGTVAVFRDLYGNLWDLIQRKK